MRLRSPLLVLCSSLAMQNPSPVHAEAPPDAAASTTCTEYTATVAGIDVSKYQGVVDWPAVQKAGVGFAFIRVSDGLDSPDEHFAANWAGAHAVGLLRGAYQYFRPSEDAAAQAGLFLKAVMRLRPGDLPPVLDVETLDDLPAKDVVQQLRTWLSVVAKRTGRTPILYTNSSTWTALGAPDMRAYLLWMARWEAQCPPPLAGFARWHFWQYANDGQVDGIKGAVDLDWFNGTLADLRLLAGHRPLVRRRVKPPK